ncbi:hypothetical protein IJS77_02655 [bacterium]|nr:hypothetical protein [bacterium]
MDYCNFSIANFKINKNLKENKQKKYNNLSPLRCDTVSFGALKKAQFSGIDLLVVNKFKAPIEKFNSNVDLQNWCKNKVKNIVNKDYQGRQQETVVQRKAMLKEWFDYVQKENDAYSDSISLLILDGITKDLKPNEDSLPPVLNKGILADTISQIQEKTKANPKLDVNFSKLYQMNLQKSMLNMEKGENISDITGWVIIPSKENDPEHFEKNVEKLKLLSHDNWCTKSFNAEPYLSKGDFHVYLENGKPKLGVRFVGDEIQEIQGEKNNSKIPVIYFDVAMEHVKDKKLSERAFREIRHGKYLKEKVEKFEKKMFKNGIENATPEEIVKIFNIKVRKDKIGNLQLYSRCKFKEGFAFEDFKIDKKKIIKYLKVKADELKEKLKNASSEEIFKTFGIDVKKDNDGFLIISKYCPPRTGFSYEDYGIDENELIKNVKIIEDFALFADSKITDLGNLQTIGGEATFYGSQVTDLSNLQTIGGNADFRGSQVTDLGNLQTIGGNADFRGSQVTDLGNLQTIGGDADFSGSQVTDLGNLQTIGGYAEFCKSNVSDIENLQKIGIGCSADISQTELIKKLEEKGFEVDIENK